MKKIKILHIITGLNTGGAEGVLLRNLKLMDSNTFAHYVLCLTNKGPVASEIEALGIPVHSLGIRRDGLPSPGTLLRLLTHPSYKKADIVQTWMYHADLVGGIAAKLKSNAKVVWNIRQSTLSNKHSKKLTIFTAWSCALLSKIIPTKIICGSYAAKGAHINMGYVDTKFEIIPNGFDFEHFRPDKTARARLQEELGLPDDAIIVGNVARLDPQKDHQTLLSAAKTICQQNEKVHFVLYGDKVNPDHPFFAEKLSSPSLKGRCHLLGMRSDMTSIYPAFDFLVLCSAYGEGAPNVIGEGMASGVPCIATDVGDSFRMIGETGKTIPPSNPEALSSAVLEFCQMPHSERTILGEKARQQIIERFPIDTMVRQYENLYRQIVR